MSTPPVKPGPRYQALLQVLRTSEALWGASRTFFARWDLSPSQFNILNLLHARIDGLSQTELSLELITHKSNITGLVDRLEKRGLLSRESDPSDRRAYRVTATRAGRRLTEEILPHYYQIAERVWGEVSPTEARALASLLATLSQNATEVLTPADQDALKA